MHLKKCTELFAFNIVRTAKTIINLSDFPSQCRVASSGIQRNRKCWTHIAKRAALWLGAYETLLPRSPLFNAFSRVPTSMQYLRTPWFAKICKNRRCETSCFLLATDTWNRFFYARLRAFLSRWDIQGLTEKPDEF